MELYGDAAEREVEVLECLRAGRFVLDKVLAADVAGLFIYPFAHVEVYVAALSHLWLGIDTGYALAFEQHAFDAVLAEGGHQVGGGLVHNDVGLYQPYGKLAHPGHGGSGGAEFLGEH